MPKKNLYIREEDAPLFARAEELGKRGGDSLSQLVTETLRSYVAEKDSGSNERYRLLLERDRTRDADVERKALFFILSGNEDLFSKVNRIYDFSDRAINPDCFNQVDLSSGAIKLVKLAFNLYNGFPADVLDIFSTLDKENFELAIHAIKIRFGQAD